MINWNNMDTLASYKALEDAKTVNLAQEMGGENGAKRVKSYTVPMGAGMNFNYGARPVDDAILAKLADFAAEAQLASTQVQLDTLKKSISDCAVTSPLTGVVTQRNVEIGGFASSAAPSYVVMDLSTIKVEVGVSEQVLNTIKIGDKVDVTMTAVSELPLEGTVSTVSPAAGQTGMYTVKVELDNADGIIKAGMMAEVNFTAEKAEDTIVLPRNSVITKEDETYVYVVKGNTAKKVMVELGIEAADTIEITKGLKKGDDVVTKGQTYISDGEEVNVVNADAETKDKKDKKEEKGE